MIGAQINDMLWATDAINIHVREMFPKLFCLSAFY